MKEMFKNLGERAMMKLAWILPASLVKWCFIRVSCQATQGIYSSQVVPELTVMEALRRWKEIDSPIFEEISRTVDNSKLPKIKIILK